MDGTLGKIGAGLIAGAAGVTALNVMTYLDMAVRGRPPSSLPEDTAGELARRTGVDLGEKAEARREGIGPLLGIAAGLGCGAVYGLFRAVVPRCPVPLAAAGVGLAALVTADAPMAALGVTDVRTWGPRGWLADLIPHVGYGLATAITYEMLKS
ncbi:hypothetical protein J5X84_01995 [Streptosporangiaceae bacterium NEAU-GS5]|nr:hypothetical protein [Streptosporangiaceae bacterium NEAU-GS5]